MNEEPTEGAPQAQAPQTSLQRRDRLEQAGHRFDLHYLRGKASLLLGILTLLSLPLIFLGWLGWILNSSSVLGHSLFWFCPLFGCAVLVFGSVTRRLARRDLAAVPPEQAGLRWVAAAKEAQNLGRVCVITGLVFLGVSVLVAFLTVCLFVWVPPGPGFFEIGEVPAVHLDFHAAAVPVRQGHNGSSIRLHTVPTRRSLISA